MAEPLLQDVAAVRRFNRFYTRQIGVLQEVLLKSPFSLSEARVIYELAHHERTTATALGERLGLDAGYLSRMLRGFEKSGLIAREPSSTDGRQHLLALTGKGREEFARLDSASGAEIGAMLGTLSAEEQRRLVRSMDAIEELLGGPSGPGEPCLLRPHRPGDMGWVVQCHGALYAREYGWGEEFEALVAEIVASFLRRFDPERDRCWIAEKAGENVGSVFIVQHPELPDVARLRLLLVDPRARGLGLGNRLVDECIGFARQAGYRKITLWTNSVLDAARHIYQRAGFQLVEEKPHHSFGHDLVGQTWELEL